MGDHNSDRARVTRDHKINAKKYDGIRRRCVQKLNPDYKSGMESEAHLIIID